MQPRSTLARDLLLLWLVGIAGAAALVAIDFARDGGRWMLMVPYPSPEPSRVAIAAAFVLEFARQRPLAAVALVGIPPLLVLVTLAVALAAVLRRRTRVVA